MALEFTDMTLNAEEVGAVYAVFNTLLNLDDIRLESLRLGTLTHKAMEELKRKIYYADFCKAYNIKYEEMTEEDTEEAYFYYHPEIGNDQYNETHWVDCYYD